MKLSTEKKLALKISIVSFLVLIFILGSIVLSSYLYAKNRAYLEFVDERRVFDGMRFIESESGGSRLISMGAMGKMDVLGPRRGPRDVIIFDSEKNIIKNDVIDLDSENIEQLFSFNKTRNTVVSIDGKKFLMAREEVNGYTFFLLHDLTPIHEYYEQLLLISLIGSLLGFIIIFMMSNHLAKLTITPIREHNKELDAYSHNVAHELRTPLAIMRQNLELLKLKPSEKLIQSTDEEITGMERIIDTLLFLAKPEQNHQPKEETNITKEIATILEGLKNPEIHFSHPKKGVITRLRPELFRRVMNNLIENALKYRSEGIINITLSEKGIAIENYISIDMSDHEVAKLTKAFYQGDTSRNTSGYGLGLALVSKIASIEGWTFSIQAKNKKFLVNITF